MVKEDLIVRKKLISLLVLLVAAICVICVVYLFIVNVHIDNLSSGEPAHYAWELSDGKYAFDVQVWRYTIPFFGNVYKTKVFGVGLQKYDFDILNWPKVLPEHNILHKDEQIWIEPAPGWRVESKGE